MEVRIAQDVPDQASAAGAELIGRPGLGGIARDGRGFALDLQLRGIESHPVRRVLAVFPDQERLRGGTDLARRDIQEPRLDLLAKLDHMVPHPLAGFSCEVRLAFVRKRQFPPHRLQLHQRANLFLHRRRESTRLSPDISG